MNLAATLEARAAAGGFQDRPALVVDQRTHTHHEIHDGAARTASLLAGLRVERGDRVLLALPDGIELAWAFLGAVRLGALAVPVNPQLPVDDHRGLAADCLATAVVCTEALAERFRPRTGGNNPACTVVVSEELTAALASHKPHPPATVGAAEGAYAQYTSGTTGAPRAAVHRHGDPLVYAAAFAEPALRLGRDDVILSVSKMFFAYGLGNSLFFPLLTGARAVVHPGRPRAEDIAALAARHRATVLFAVPTFYANLLRSGCAAPPWTGRSRTEEVPFASVRVAVSAGERLTAGLAERTAALLGCPVLDSLGSTEVGQAFVGGAVGHVRTGTVGRVLAPYEIAVRGEDGEARPAGAVGMLWVRGPTILAEYLGQPEATAAAVSDGWLCTGDLASVDDDGYLSHHGRADDMEMAGGVNVAPHEIEELLSGHPAVSEVAVAAVADAYGASRLRAFVVACAGVTADERLGTELVELTRSRLAAHKVPRSVCFVDALPRTATGKLRRFLLRSDEAWPALTHVG